MMIPKLFRRLALSTAVLLLLTSAVAAQRQERAVDSWKPLHYDVSLSFNEQLTEIAAGRVVISLQVLAQNLRVIDLDFGEMPVDSVLLSGKAAQYERTNGKLNVTLPDNPAAQYQWPYNDYYYHYVILLYVLSYCH